MEQFTPPHPLVQAAKAYGSEASLARALGVSRGALNQWKKPGREVPAQHAPEIERLTGIACELLCPSVRWSLVRVPIQEATLSTPQPKTEPSDGLIPIGPTNVITKGGAHA